MFSRNLSPQHMFEQMALELKPEFHFEDGAWKGRQGFEKWKAAALPRVLATMGECPPRVDPNPQLMVEWEHDGLRKQRWLIDVGPHIAAAFQINYPLDMEADERRPALLCWHGHGPFGKEPVMGNDSSPELRAAIGFHNYNYGHQMAKAGFVTFAIDWIGMGERNDGRKPHNLNRDFGRDWCNIYYLHATMLGMTSISINLTHGMAATDFACTLPGVDPQALGVMGLSGGGATTVWTGLGDERFKAMEIIGYSDLWALFGMRDTNYCGMQVAPGLFRLVDLPDLQGLLAPRPLLVDIGAYDTCFQVDNATTCFRQVEKIYEAAGAREKLELDLFPGEHGWGGRRSVEFFTRHLGAPERRRNQRRATERRADLRLQEQRKTQRRAAERRAAAKGKESR